MTVWGVRCGGLRCRWSQHLWIETCLSNLEVQWSQVHLRIQSGYGKIRLLRCKIHRIHRDDIARAVGALCVSSSLLEHRS